MFNESKTIVTGMATVDRRTCPLLRILETPKVRDDSLLRDVPETAEHAGNTLALVAHQLRLGLRKGAKAASLLGMLYIFKRFDRHSKI